MIVLLGGELNAETEHQTARVFHKSIQAPEVYLGWLVGTLADEERQSLLEGLSDDPNSGLLSVASTYWICYCAHKLIRKFTKTESPHLTLGPMKTDEFRNSVRRYASKATAMFYDAGVDAYDRDLYGSFKSTLRSSKFLQKIDSKINLRVMQVGPKSLPGPRLTGHLRCPARDGLFRPTETA